MFAKGRAFDGRRAFAIGISLLLLGLALVSKAALPSITTPPEPHTVLAGSTVTFTVVANGTSPLFYVWRRDGSNIFGAPSSDTLVLPNVKVSAAISVLVSNAFGSVLAGPVALTVNSPPYISSQPSSVTVPPDSQASFNVMASGNAPLAFQWRFNGAEVPGATGQNLVVSNAQNSDAGDYTVVITNGFGAVTSAVAVLTVDPTAYLHWAWARKVGGPAEQWAQSVAVGPEGQCYVAGRFALATDFGGQTLPTPSSNERDVFLAQYDPSGGLVWVRRAGDGQGHVGADAVGVAADSSGNVFIAGNIQNRATFKSSIFVSKYDSSGSVLWTSVSSSANYHFAGNLALDAAGNAYLVGNFVRWALFGGRGVTNNSALGGFLAKYDSAGTVAWAQALSGTATVDEVNGVTVDAQTNIFVTGAFANPVDFGTGVLTPANSFYQDVFLAKYNADGSNVWARRAGGTTGDYGQTIATDATGNSYLAGYFTGSATFGTNTLMSAGYNDGFLAKYDPSGNLLWTRAIGGADYDVAYAVAVDSAGGVFVGGALGSGTSSFGETNLTSAGNGSGFVAKYNGQGGCVWAANIGGPSFSGIYAIALQGSSNLLVGGQFGYSPSGAISFDSVTLAHDGGGDGFLAKLTGIDLISPPVVTNPPVESAMSPGSGLALTAQAYGGGHMTYQWRVNDVDIPGATSSTLNLSGLSLDAAGLYTVVARNALGAATNLAANLTLWSLQVTGSMALFNVAGPPGGEYQIEWTSSFPSSWVPMTNLTVLDGSAQLLTTNAVEAPTRFYRLKRVSP